MFQNYSQKEYSGPLHTLLSSHLNNGKNWIFNLFFLFKDILTGETYYTEQSYTLAQPQKNGIPLNLNWLKHKFSVLLLIFITVTSPLFSNEVRNPFPTSGNYNTYIKPTSFTTAQLNAHATSFYDLWKARYLKTDCGDYYVWNSQNDEKTVSEAHGYGMMLTAYFAGHDANAKSIFDGLYNYFRKNASNASQDLMDWKQLTCNDAPSTGDNSASDGDIDIAYALLLAHVQWGSNGEINYLKEAVDVINAIMQYDINQETWTVKLGDWSTPSSPNYYYSTRTSDFIPSHFRAFAAATGNSNWNRVIDKCYELIETMQTNHAPNTGLMPDFIINTNTTPTPAGANFLEGVNDGDYYYNACRNAWRLGLDYLLNGETRASDAVGKLNTWLATSTGNNASQVVNGYKLDGTQIHGFNDATFVGPLTVGGMLDTSRQSWLNSLYSTLNYTSALSGDYYSDTIKLLSLLTISGNYWTPTSEMLQPEPNIEQTNPGKYVVGYYAQWAIYARDYNVSDIHAENLTHLMYAFYDTLFDEAMGISTIETLDSYADTEHTEDPGVDFSSEIRGNLGAIKVLKEENPHLKVLISLGGWTKSMAFPALANTESGRKTLAQAMVNFINNYPFIDGFDIDWEFPVEGGIEGQPHTPNDHKNLVYLLKEMRQTFDTAFPGQKKWVTMAGGNNVLNLLSTHVGPGTEGDHGITENIADYADFITFFGYDFGGNWFDKTSYNAPLYPSNNPEDPLHRLPGNVDPLYKGSGVPQQALDDLVTLYLDHLGIPKEKLVMGIPFYGRLFDNVVDGEVETGLPGLFRTAPRYQSTACLSGVYSPQGSWDTNICEQSGSIGFSDLSQGVATNPHHYLDPNDFGKVSATAAANGWVKYWDDTAKVPYLYNSMTNQFVSYDDPESVDIKVRYALEKELGGVMIWELSEDSRDRFGTTQLSNGAALLDQINTSLTSIQVSITVNFKDESDAPIEGVEASISNRDGVLIETQTSNAQGEVVFSELDGYRTYSISYTKDGFAFLPEQKNIASEEVYGNRTYSILGSNNLVQISGTVRLDGVGAAVEINLLNTNNETIKTVNSDTSGSFVFENLIAETDYRITATKNFYTFPTLNYPNITNDVSGVVLEGIRDTYTISGTVKDTAGAGISGVQLLLTGAESKQTTSDANGNYEFLDLIAGRNYTLVASATDQNFIPQEVAFEPLRQNENVDFTLNNGYFFGTVKDGSNPVSGVTMQLVFNYVSNLLPYVMATTTTNENGEYVFEDEFTYSNTNYKISDYAAAGKSGNIGYQSWTTGGLVFMPTTYDFADGEIPTSPKQFDFNTQQPAPAITILSPTEDLIVIPASGTVTLVAQVKISPADESITVSQVTFTIDGQKVTATKSGTQYDAIWNPTEADFGTPHNFVVSSIASNGEDAEKSFPFELTCSGLGCPNIPPEITLNSPSNLTVNQTGGFEAINFDISVSDTDGNVNAVTISIGGETPSILSPGTGGNYQYTFTPSAYTEYEVEITATDDSGDTSTYRGTLRILDSPFTPLPDGPIILGFAHNWDAVAAPFIYYRDIAQTKYNVVAYSFIETQNLDGYTPVLTILESRYQTAGAFDKQKLIDDIKVLKENGVPVVVSIGGANGHVVLETKQQKDIFVEGIKAIIDEYGFDGVDIDFEGGSMDFGAGALTDFSYESTAAYPRLRNVIDAFKELKEFYGEGFILTCAPETFYVQVGASTYSNRAGSFLPVLHNLREELDLVMVQLYNTGSITALDGQAYSQGTPDFIVSMSDMLMEGFDVGATGFHFDPLPASKILVAIPSCPSAAPAGGYLMPEEAIKGLDYLRFGTDFEGRRYTLQSNPRSNLRGMMTWSINWDAAPNCASEYEFINSYYDYFFDTISLPQIEITQLTSGMVSTTFTGIVSLTVEVILSPMDGTATVSEVVFDVAGQQLNGLPIGNNQYQVSWNPNDSDFGMTHTVRVSAQATNNQTADLDFEIELLCVGNDCPNALPILNFLQPDPPTVAQSTGFEPITIQVEATDSDGSIAQVELQINSNPPVSLSTATVSNVYEYDFTPAAFGDYTLLFIATDDRSATQSLTLTLTVSNTNPPDEDNDGVPDKDDLCPNTPIDEIELVNAEGCAPSQLVTGTLADLLAPEDWETLFPYRNGYDTNTSTRTGDFYTYQSFANAINRISAFELMIERRCGTNLQKITHFNKATGVETLISTSEFYNASWNANIPIVKESVSYANFLNEGDLTQRKRELAAFLANISHETTGGPETGNTYEWGLFFLIEGGGNSTPGPYAVPHNDYPPVEGQSYYGRGPIQLSYNYNYGQASEHIFGDKNKLLENPELLETDAEISFMTAIWFWMTPQAPKPSAHDVIIDAYTPSQEEIDAGRTNGFGTTVNIINGGVECGDGGEEGYQVVDRINYYKRYTDIFEVSTDLDGTDDCSDCGCASASNYVQLTFTEDCDGELPGITILTPLNGTLTQTLNLAPVTITTSVSTASLTESNFAVDVDGATFYEQSFDWQPRFFKSYTITATVDLDAIPYYDTSIITLYDNNNAIDCSGITSYVEGVDYDGGRVVNFNGTIYRAKYYASDNPTIEPAAWTEIGNCLSNIPPEIGLTSSTLDDSIFTISAIVTDTQGVYFIEFYQEGRLMQTVNPRTSLTEVVNSAIASYTVITSSANPHTVEVRAYDKHGALNQQTITVQRPANSCGIPQWYSDLEYLFPGGSAPPAYVEYNGSIYRNTGYVGVAPGNEPGTHANWTLVTNSCSDLVNLPLAENCDTAILWNPTVENYNTNDLVEYNGGLYRVKYYIAGNVVPDRYAAYDFIGLCVNPPVLESGFEGDTTWLMPDAIESLTLSATLNTFGFDPSSLKVGIRPMGGSTTTTYTLTNAGNDSYTYTWTPPAYGIYELVFVATNSANQQSVLRGNVSVVSSLPPEITLLSPEEGSAFVQQSFTAVPVNFRVDNNGTAVATVTIEDLTASTKSILPLEASNTYNFDWIPTAYGKNNLLISAVNLNGDTAILPLNYELRDPTMETLVLSDPNLFQIVATETITKTFTFDEAITGLKMRDTTTASITISGNRLIVSNASVGRSGLEIITATGSYFIGLRIDHLDGTVAGLPDHVAIGSVSEDVPNDLDFWQDLDNVNLLKNKQVDSRYIYINGGAYTGWPIDNPTRVVNYIKNSLRFGLIPSFIYYQIPHQNESYSRNDQFIRDDEYMRAYFENINLFLDDVQKFIGDELFYVILEPDFLGYIQQRGESVNRATAVGLDEFYDNVESIHDTQGGTLRNLVLRINREFDTRRKEDNLNLLFGWQLNLWANPADAGHFGIIRQTDAVTGDISSTLQEIRSVAESIGQFGIDAGILSSDADFVSIDKYGLDAIGGPRPVVNNADPLTQPEEFTWFWNNDHWLNYLEFVDALRDLTQKHIVLWQVPVGHINKSQTISAYTGSRFTDLTNEGMRYEDSATTFFFGDEVQLETQERWDYFTQNKHNDPKLIEVDETTRTLTFGSHMEETLAAGVRLVLMGAGVGASTNGVGSPPTDDYFWIQKVQEYYKNAPVELPDADGDGVNDFDDLCPNTPFGEEVNVNGCSESQLDDDNDGVKNNMDQCPFTPEGESVNADGCSESQLDDDNDGVNNAEDNCPTTPNPDQADANMNGTGDVCEDCTLLPPTIPELTTLTSSCTTLAIVAPTTTDACSNTIVGTTSSALTFDTEGTYVITWIFTDTNSNSITVTQTVIIDDTENPMDPNLEPISGTCSLTVPIPTTTDNCAGTVTGTTNNPLSYTKAGVYTITWAFNDGNGNTLGVKQSVRLSDEVAPVVPDLNPIQGECSVVAPVPVAQDACAGTVTGTTTSTLSFDNLGEYVILWTFDDGNGNTTTATQTVSVEDNTAPVAPVLATVSGTCSVEITQIPVAVDNCAGTITGTTEDSLTYNTPGEYTIRWVFDDGNGNSSSATQTVTLTDSDQILLPEIQPLTGECSVTVVEYPVALDTCTGMVTGTTTDDLFYDQIGEYGITWSFDFGNGRIETTTQTVTVKDSQAPIVQTLAPFSGSCSLTVTTIPTAVDACVGTVTATTSDVLIFDEIGNYTITWYFDDGNGNVSTATQTVNIRDENPPIPPTLNTITASCSLTVSTVPVALDSCEGTVTGTTTSTLSFDNLGEYVILWTFDDGNGNVSTATQSVVIDDSTPPIAPVLSEVTGQCSATVTNIPTAVDNCSDTVTGTTTDALQYDTPGTYMITWTFTDTAGNSSTATQTIVVQDTTPPIALAQDITVSLNALGTATISATQIDNGSTDNCGVVSMEIDKTAFNCNNLGSNDVVLTITDGSGNTATATATVIVEDDFAPEIPTLNPVSGQCSVTVNSVPTTMDNCSGSVTGTTSDALQYDAQGTYMITWTFTDTAGNSSVATQTVIVDDTTPPAAPILPQVTGQCSATVTNIPTAVDNCSDTVTGTTTDALQYNAQGTYMITWTFTDTAGNSSTATQTVIVDDTIEPIAPASLPLISAECEVSVTTYPTALDNCVGTVTATTLNSLSYNEVGIYEILWVFDDGNGNVSTATQTVEVYDNIAPVAPVLTTVSATCSIDLPIPQASDNCEGVIFGTSSNSTSFTESGIYNVTWLFDDGNGNSSVATQTVIITDNEAPLVPQLEVIRASCSVTVPTPTAEDNCDGTIIGTTTSSTTFDLPGVYQILWTFIDSDNNSSMVTQTIIVDENLPEVLTNLLPITVQCNVEIPIATVRNTCNGEIVMGTTSDSLIFDTQGTYMINWTFPNSDGSSQVAIQEVIVQDTQPPTAPTLATISSVCSVTVAIPTAVDNCSGLVSGHTSDPLTYEEQGTYTINWTFTDSQGNSVQTQQNVIIQDDISPLIPSLEPITINCGAPIPTPTTTDNCAGEIVGTTTLPENFHIAGIYTLNWIFNDGNGNRSQTSQTVQVIDNTPPIVPTLEAVDAFCGEIIENPTIIDDCSGLPIIGRTSDPVSFDSDGEYSIEWIFTDVNNNQTNAVQKVVVTSSAPSIPELPFLSDSCTVIVPQAIATDPCSGSRILGTTPDPLVYSELGNYTVHWTFTDRFGRETVASQNVEVLPDGEVVDVIEACISYTWLDGITYTENNNEARFIEVTAEGCEIIHTLDLTITQIDAAMSRTGNTLIANQENANYQWIRCGTTSETILGATSREYIPTQNGSYAVMTTVNNCVEVSECFDFTIDVSVAEDEILVFPIPPTDNVLNIVVSKSLNFIKIELMSIDNRLILEETFNNPVSSTALNIPNLATGTYFVRLTSSEGNVYTKQIIIL